MRGAGKRGIGKEYLYATGAVLAWGTAAPVLKAVMGRASEEFLLFASAGLSFLFLLGLNLRNRNRIREAGYRGRDYLAMACLGFVGLALYSYLYYTGIARLPAAEACTLNYLWPMMIVVFSIPILKEKMTLSKGLGILSSFAGVVLIATQGKLADLGQADLSGVFRCLGAALCYGLFCVLLKKYAYDESLLLCIAYLVTAVFSGMLCWKNGSFAPVGFGEGLGIVWNGVGVNAVAYLLWARGLKQGDTAKISNIAYFTPFLSVVFGKLLLHENVTLWSLSGLVLIGFGMLVQVAARSVSNSSCHRAACSSETSGRPFKE